MFRFLKRKLKPSQVSSECTWWDENNRQYDTVVFVHGILGNQTKTWGDFPALLHDDQELPKLAILHWGYRSGWRPSSYHGVKTESEGLFSNLRVSAESGEPIHVVAHSMGGLVTLSCVVYALTEHDANSHPVNSISLITLYATPLRGSALADRLLALVNRFRVTRWLGKVLPKKQLENLQSSGFVDELLSDVDKYVKTVGVDEATPGENVTVQIVVAKRDSAVSQESAKGLFSDDPPTLVLEGTHGSVKLPDHHGDIRYEALKNNLEIKLAIRINTLAMQWKEPNNPTEYKMAKLRIAEQYCDQIEHCQEACFGGRFLTEPEEDDVFDTFLDYASEGVYTPEQLMRMTIADFTVPDAHVRTGNQ